MTKNWTFNPNYPGIGPALICGACILAIKDATMETLNLCPAALEWLEGGF